MKTRSTTRAEAAGLQVSTRSKARVLMAPPVSRFNSDRPSTIDYKRPQQKARKPNAQIMPLHPAEQAQKNLACQPIDLITANKSER